MSSVPRYALFGGSFDPPHRGHVAIAKAAADAFRLDRVLFAPAGLQPLKHSAGATPYAQRMAMAELACQSDSRFTVSGLDAPRPDLQPNYTVDTLRTLRETYPSATLFNLAGADSFHDLGRWRQPELLLKLAEWIVVSRPGYDLADPAEYPLTSAQRARVHLLDAVHMDAAATTLRHRLAEGDPCEDLLTEPVAAYIRAHRLYRSA